MSARATDVARACDRLVAAREPLVARPWKEIAEVLGSVGARFTDRSDPLRTEVLTRLPSEAGLSERMAEVVLEGMAADWTAERLRRLMAEEFSEPGCLDGFVRVRSGGPTDSDSPEGAGRELMAFGPSLCLQVVSGSVPGVGVNALLRSLLVKAPTLIKPGRGDRALTEAYARGLAEVDEALSAALEVLYWPGEDEARTREALRRADVATVYGSDRTVAALRVLAPPTTRVVTYHHREGVAVVGRDVPSRGRGGEIAAHTARAVALFEQRGCVCPHVVYAERGGEVEPPAFAELLAEALEALESELPSAELLPEEGAAVQQLRGTAELAAAAGAASVHHGGRRASWTVVYEEEPMAGAPVTLGRGVRVRPVSDVSDLPGVLAPKGPHLQSVAHAGLGSRVVSFAEGLGRIGASRVVPMDRVSFPEPWWLHDGRGPLRELVRWVELERQGP